MVLLALGSLKHSSTQDMHTPSVYSRFVGTPVPSYVSARQLRLHTSQHCAIVKRTTSSFPNDCKWAIMQPNGLKGSHDTSSVQHGVSCWKSHVDTEQRGGQTDSFALPASMGHGSAGLPSFSKSLCLAFKVVDRCIDKMAQLRKNRPQP
eukprot:6061196-Amphidinium_carterae.1